jgi:hypothetical protein
VAGRLDPSTDQINETDMEMKEGKDDIAGNAVIEVISSAFANPLLRSPITRLDPSILNLRDEASLVTPPLQRVNGDELAVSCCSRAFIGSLGGNNIEERRRLGG